MVYCSIRLLRLGAVALVLLSAPCAALTELERVAEAGDLDALSRLLDAGEAIEQVDRQSVWRRTALLAAARVGQAEALKLLLERGADANARDAGGATALRVAVREGQVESVQILLAAGADVEADRNEHGWTPLVWAVREAGNRPLSMRAKYVEIVRLLAQAKAVCPAPFWLPMKRRSIALERAAAQLGDPMVEAIALICR